ncbi:hypothetical protein ES705_04767 [subsurface metagenome]
MQDNVKKVVDLFTKVIKQGEEIKETCKRLYFSGDKKTVPPQTFEAWKTNCLSLLKSTFGASSPQYDRFANLKFFDYYNSMQIFLGILKGSREDVEKGYFFHKDLMLSVNIYDSLISRAGVSVDNDQGEKAAVILEITLQEILTKICENKKIKYNREEDTQALAEKLASIGVLNDDIHSQVKRYAERLEQGAADSIPTAELAEIIQWLRDFLNDYLGSRIIILN